MSGRPPPALPVQAKERHRPMPPLIKPPRAAEDLNLTLLASAFPAFRLSQDTYGRRCRWVAVRRNSTDQGLHTVVTADLTELQAALVLDEARAGSSRHTGSSEPGPRP